MLFRWLKNRRRRQLLAAPFPPAWEAILRARVGHYALLPDQDRPRLRDALRIILAEKSWEGCRGLELTDEMRVTIAALAAVLVLGLRDYYFDNVQTVLVYPDPFVVPEDKPIGGEVMIHDEADMLGQAHYRGPVLLTWSEVQEQAADPGYGENLVFHEFAHQLDMLNGEADGVPTLPDRAMQRRWQKVMAAEYRRLSRTSRRRDTLLDPYGATDPAEFFAVATECFFDAPGPMRDEYPELYALLRDYFGQDPAAWDWAKEV